MNYRTLEKMVNELEDLAPQAKFSKHANSLRTDSMDMLYNDVFNEYYKKYKELGDRYIKAWDVVVSSRLNGILAGHQKSDFIKFREKWRGFCSSYPVIGLIHFGQKRIASNFSESRSVDQNNVIGLPDANSMNGRPLDVVAGLLDSGDLKADQNPIKIFFSERHSKWVAANNRSYAAHCIAGVKPLRLWPAMPSQEEKNRLDEVMEAAEVRGYLGTPDRPTLPRSLPSLEMPLTNGANDIYITRVAKVPASFFVDWR